MKLLIHSLDGMNVKSRMFRPRRKKEEREIIRRRLATMFGVSKSER